MPDRPQRRAPDPQARAVVATQGQPAPSSALVPVAQAVQRLEADLASRMDELTIGLAGAFPADYFTKVALTQFRRSPGVMMEVAASPQGRASFVAAVVQAAEAGVPFIMGRAYLVPFRNKGVQEVQLIIGYQGLVDLVTAPGTGVTFVEAAGVRAKDEFDYQRGTGGYLHHSEWRPGTLTTDSPQADWVYDRGARTYFWARVVYANGQDRWDVMSYAQVEAIRKRSWAGQDGPWITDYDEMGKKTVLRRICKTQRISLKAMRVIDREDDWEAERSRQARQVGGSDQQAQLRRQLQRRMGGAEQPVADDALEVEAVDVTGDSGQPAASHGDAGVAATTTAPAGDSVAEAAPGVAPVVAAVDNPAAPAQADAQPVDKSPRGQAACGATVQDGDTWITCGLAPGHRGDHSDGQHDWPRR